MSGESIEASALLQLALRAACDPSVRTALATAVAAGDGDWSAVCELAEGERIAPLLHAVLADMPGVPASAAARLADAYADNAARNRHFRAELGPVLDALDRARIPVLVLKGAALIESLYADIAVRRMSDIDLLVHRRDVAAARAVLARLGFAPLQAEPRAGLGIAYDNGAPLRKDGPRRTRLGLHWSLFDSPYYQYAMPMDWFWETAEAVEIAGRPARMLGPTAQILHLCGHLRLHHSGRELRWLHDIAALIARHGERIDWPTVLERARRFDLVLPLQDVLGRVVAGWNVAVPAPVLERLHALAPSRREARVFRWLTQARRSPARRLWIDLATLPGVRPRVAFAWANVLPSTAYMRERYGIRHRALVPLYYPYRWMRALRGAR